MLDKTFVPSEVEGRLYRQWEESGAFACGAPSGRAGNAEPYAIVIPPPNVTGSLHMGHALNNTLQDIMIRLQRMRGRDVLWQPGMDHAGIATQMVVERMLEAEGKTRQDLGREKFIERVWEWKDESGGTITGQLRRLGASCDWQRERFTMDEGLSAAVRKVFVDLYKQGLIYKDNRLVNWDPKLKTAISDLEVQQTEVAGHLWHINYPLEAEGGEDGGGKFITVATTRPETMLGDTAIAVHPDDARYKDLVGKYAILPLVGRRLIIVADDYADPEQGSGAVKMTPAHDFNDFEVGRRHDLEMINVLDEEARINDNAPEAYRGLERFAAREKVLADLEALGLIVQIDAHTHTVPYGDRGNVPIEPWLTEQWYVDAETLAKPAIAAVRSGRTKFVPKMWEKTYYEWMENIQPWCISRQLWWGHQIPAWYGPDGEIFVEMTFEAVEAAALAHYGEKVELRRDEDVLDTWFSSGLWPLSTLGWPEQTPELERYYPTALLVTGFDIIFFWVARMMMLGLHFADEVPFDTVYIHALVRDAKGQKMSKSKGNIIDPLELIDKYGADALRFTLASQAAQGRDVKLSEQRIEGNRNFATKLWNAARFCEMNECALSPDFDPGAVTGTVNQWLVGQFKAAQDRISAGLDGYRFNEAANDAYHFVWGTFCDWYVEFSKPVLQGPDGPARDETRATAAWGLDAILRLLHPFMPFVTEELWARTVAAGARETMLVTAPWPDYGDELVNGAATAEIEWVIRVVSEIRSVRAEMNVPPGAYIPLLLGGASPETLARLERQKDLVTTLARISETGVQQGDLPPGSVQTVVDEATLVLPLADVIDIDQERQRLAKAVDKLDGQITGMTKKLANKGFTDGAPAEVVEIQRERLAEAEQTRAKLQDALSRF
ncbi:MAG: valine--tRNA ligase [Alphaproteobacteria bacterium]|nr:valine--tRNA ligase [Alphaproteobacteria bacterium]